MIRIENLSKDFSGKRALENINFTIRPCQFEHSQVVVFIIDGGKVIGCGRALTDFIAQAAIYNVAVAPQFRRRGLGEFIVNRLVRSAEHCNVILYTRSDTVDWYRKLGFELMKTGMVKYQSDSAAQMRAMGFI